MGDKGREKIAKALDDWKDEEFLEGGVADVTHHPIPPKHNQGMHRARLNRVVIITLLCR